MAKATWSVKGTEVVLATTQMDGVANNATVESVENDNGVDREFYGDFEFLQGSGVNLTGSDNPAVYLWFLQDLDGTNFESYTVVPGRPPDVILGAEEQNATQRLHAARVVLPNGNFKCLIQNVTGAAFPGSGNVLKMWKYSEESN